MTCYQGWQLEHAHNLTGTTSGDFAESQTHAINTNRLKDPNLMSNPICEKLLGPYPQRGNHLRVSKCEMIGVVLGKPSGGLTPDARMIPLGVVISNRPAD